DAVGARQPAGALDLLRDGNEGGIARPDRPPVRRSVHHAARFIASVTLCPPNPKEFESAMSTGRLTALFAAESRSQAGSGVNWLMVGGMSPVVSTSAQTAA